MWRWPQLLCRRLRLRKLLGHHHHRPQPRRASLTRGPPARRQRRGNRASLVDPGTMLRRAWTLRPRAAAVAAASKVDSGWRETRSAGLPSNVHSLQRAPRMEALSERLVNPFEFGEVRENKER